MTALASTNQHALAEIEETRMIISFAVSRCRLTLTEFAAIEAFMQGISERQVGARMGMSHGAIYMAKVAALKKLRAQLLRMGFSSADDFFSGEPRELARGNSPSGLLATTSRLLPGQRCW